MKRTQLLLRRRAFLVGFGYLFTTLPLALAGRSWGPVWFGVPGIRFLATACAAAAAAGWLAFMRNARELYGTGLQPLWSRGPLLAWGFGCWWFANSAAVVVNEWLPGRLGAYRIGFLLLAFAFWAAGLKLHQFRRFYDVDGPQSLFTEKAKRDGM